MAAGRVLDICISEIKGVAKDAVENAILQTDHGIVGDAHAGQDHRQVSLLAAADIEAMRRKGLDLAPGAFGENLIVDGIETSNLGIGSRLAVGPAVLEISQVGKECHDRCAIYTTTGDCIMPRTGLFAVVRAGGEITRNSPIEVLEVKPRDQTKLPIVGAEFCR